MATDMLNWNWTSAHVQTEVVNGEYITSEATLLLAGPPRLELIQQLQAFDAAVSAGRAFGALLSGGNGGNPSSTDAASTALTPIGLISNFQMNQNRAVQRLFEIGSTRAYMIPGKNFASFSLGRVMFFGPSLLRMLYSWYPNEALKFSHGKFKNAFNPSQATAVSPGGVFPVISQGDAPGFGPSSADTVGSAGSPPGVDSLSNNKDFWINLTSMVFRQSFGLCMVMKASNNKPYGATYMDDCMLEGHGFGIDAQNVVISEATNGQFDRLRPIKLIGIDQ